MKTFEEEINEMIEKYPLIFKDLSEYQSHLFRSLMEYFYQKGELNTEKEYLGEGYEHPEDLEFENK